MWCNLVCCQACGCKHDIWVYHISWLCCHGKFEAKLFTEQVSYLELIIFPNYECHGKFKAELHGTSMIFWAITFHEYVCHGKFEAEAQWNKHDISTNSYLPYMIMSCQSENKLHGACMTKKLIPAIRSHYEIRWPPHWGLTESTPTSTSMDEKLLNSKAIAISCLSS